MSANRTRPVVAVIPHYNMPQTLVVLLGQVMAQGYDAIYVLDDRSTVCNVHEVVAPFSSVVNVVAGTENRGAGGNRNRILEVGPRKLEGAILHFIDADCELLSEQTPDLVRGLFLDPRVGVAGGLINNANGAQMEFNYFPRFSLKGGLSSSLMMLAIMTGSTDPRKTKRVPSSLKRFLSDYPVPHEPSIAKEVFAVAEANMLIPYDTFAAVNGFDDTLRFAEAQDLGFKLEAKGLTARFDPAIAVKHNMILLPDRKRARYLVQSYFRLARKYGVPLR